MQSHHRVRYPSLIGARADGRTYYCALVVIAAHGQKQAWPAILVKFGTGRIIDLLLLDLGLTS